MRDKDKELVMNGHRFRSFGTPKASGFVVQVSFMKNMESQVLTIVQQPGIRHPGTAHIQVGPEPDGEDLIGLPAYRYGEQTQLPIVDAMMQLHELVKDRPEMAHVVAVVMSHLAH